MRHRVGKIIACLSFPCHPSLQLGGRVAWMATPALESIKPPAGAIHKAPTRVGRLRSTGPVCRGRSEKQGGKRRVLGVSRTVLVAGSPSHKEGIDLLRANPRILFLD